MKFPGPKLIYCCVLSASLIGVGSISGADDIQPHHEQKKNIILIAGKKSHGPENNGIHDYPWMIRYLKAALEKSSVGNQLDVSIHFDDWPSQDESVKFADAIVIISDGRDGDNGREAPHLASDDRLRLMDEAMDRGCGLMVVHFSTFAPDALSDRVLEWQGGYFDWENNGKREWYSQIQTVDALVRPAHDSHPTLNGVKAFTMNDEFYFDIRFPENDRWTPILEVPGLPALKPHGHVVSWAIQRHNGGRGYGTTCGHFYNNFQNEHFRKSILNAIVWCARLDVPNQGINASFMSMDQVDTYLKDSSHTSPEP